MAAANGKLVVWEDVQRHDTVEIPLELVTRVEVSRGSPSSAAERIRRGALQGLGGGLLVGGGIGLIRGYGAQYRNPDAGVNVLAVTARTAARFGVAGAVLGSAFGLRVRERWERLPIPRPAVLPDGASHLTLRALLPPLIRLGRPHRAGGAWFAAAPAVPAPRFDPPPDRSNHEP